MQNINDDPGVAAKAETRRKVQTEQARVRDRKQAIEMQLTVPREQQSTLAQFENGAADIASADELQQELQVLERQEKFLRDADAEAKQQLDREISRASAEICAQARPNFEADIKKARDLLKQLCAVNQSLIAKRDHLEREGVISASIPFCLVAGLGEWDNPNNPGIAGRFRRMIQEDFPNL